MIHRDLSAAPVPRITAYAHTAGFDDPDAHTPEQAAVLIGAAPMYHYRIPSTLKAWPGNVILCGRTTGETPSDDCGDCRVQLKWSSRRVRTVSTEFISATS